MYKENGNKTNIKDTKQINITVRIEDNQKETERLKRSIKTESANLTDFHNILDCFSYEICQKPHFIYREGLQRSYDYQDQINTNMTDQHQTNTVMENELNTLNEEANTLKTTLQEYQDRLAVLENKIGKKDKADTVVVN